MHTKLVGREFQPIRIFLFCVTSSESPVGNPTLMGVERAPRVAFKPESMLTMLRVWCWQQRSGHLS